ncbi:40S ribosomal protein S6-like [Prionailurus iriomotensis]
MGQDSLLHGEALSVIPSADLDHVTLPLFTQSVSSNLCDHSLLIKGMKFGFAIYFSGE